MADNQAQDLCRSDFAEDLWRRARREGASSADAKRKFGIADDVYAAGLLLAYLVFVPLSAPGSVDGPTLQRLIETTFRGDFEAIRCVPISQVLCWQGDTLWPCV